MCHGFRFIHYNQVFCPGPAGCGEKICPNGHFFPFFPVELSTVHKVDLQVRYDMPREKRRCCVICIGAIYDILENVNPRNKENPTKMRRGQRAFARCGSFKIQMQERIRNRRGSFLHQLEKTKRNRASGLRPCKPSYKNKMTIMPCSRAIVNLIHSPLMSCIMQENGIHHDSVIRTLSTVFDVCLRWSRTIKASRDPSCTCRNSTSKAPMLSTS